MVPPENRSLDLQSSGETTGSERRPLWTAQDLIRHLQGALDILIKRGALGWVDAKRHVLGLLVLRYLSDQFEDFQEFLRSMGGDPEDPDEYPIFVPRQARWPELRNEFDLVAALSRAIRALEDANPNLRGVLTTIDYGEKRWFGNRDRANELLRQLVFHFSQLDLRAHNLEGPKTVGQAFEGFLVSMAHQERAGELMTPPEIVRLLVEIMQPREGMRICDPACGSGGFLVSCADYVERNGGNSRNLFLSGQELNLEMWALCRMNLLLHGLPDAVIAQGDTLRNPKVLEGDRLILHDLVLSNPPASLSNWGHEAARHDPWGRFSLGMPPAQRGDYAFLQHMLAVLRPRGRMATLLPLSALAREGTEAEIRRGMVESDLVEAVIELPPGVLLGTNLAPAVLVANRSKSLDRRGKVFFMEVPKSPSGKRHSARSSWVMSPVEIASFFQSLREEEGMSRVVSVDEIAAHGFNLRAGLYLHKAATEAGERLDQIAEVFQGRGRAPASAQGADELPVLQGRDLGVRRLSKDDLALWPAPADKTRATWARGNDILLQRIGEKPKAMLVGKELEGSLVSDTVFVIRLREEYRPKAAYLVGFLNSPAGQKRLTRSQAASSIPTLSLRVLRGLKVPLPGTDALELFERVRKVEDDLLDRVQRALEIRSRLFEAPAAEELDTEIRRLNLESEVLRESIARSEDLEFQIRNFYPHMIAYGYRRLGSIYEDEKLLREQLVLVEVFLAFLGSIGLAMVTSLRSVAELEAQNLGRANLLECWGKGISLGKWAEICRAVSRILRESRARSAQAYSTIWTSRLERTFNRLVKIRNDDAHRRLLTTKSALRTIVEEVEKLLQDALKESLFLVQHPIRLVESVFVPWRGKAVVHKTLVYRGDHPSLQREEISYPSALTQGHLYLELEPGEWLPLYPLLSIDEWGTERRTFAVDRFNEKKRPVVLKGLEQSHDPSPEHAARVAEDLGSWLDDVFGVTEES